MNGFKLSDMISCFGLSDNKLDISHDEMRQAFNQKGSDITTFISYGVRDVEILLPLTKHIGFFNKHEEVELHNQPLSYVIFSTQQQMLDAIFCREFKTRGYLICYAQPDIQMDCDGPLRNKGALVSM